MSNETSSQPEKGTTRQGQWAAPVNKLRVSAVPDEAVNLNVEGRQVSGPLNGFGQMWQKTYRIRFEGADVEPEEVVRVWKEKFADFWPRNNHFYGRSAKIEPGEVAVLNLSGPNGMTAPGGAPVISTGIYVIYADDVSFSFMTPEGHMFAGMNTFSAFKEDGKTVAQIQALVRGSDPLFELTLRVGFGHKMEDDFWAETLRNLAAHFGARGMPSLTRICVDPRVQWSAAGNIWHNAGIRTTMYLITTPFRWIGRKIGGKKKSA